MFWQNFVILLMSYDSLRDVAFVEYTGNKSVLASSDGGIFADITPEEVDVLIGQDRESLTEDGLTLGGTKCVVMTDNLLEEDGMMDLKTKSKEEPDYSISVAKAKTVLAFIMGKKSTLSGDIHKKASAVGKYLRQSGV